MNYVKSQEDKFSVRRYNAKFRRFIDCGDFCRLTMLNFRPRPQIRKVSKNLYQKLRYMPKSDGTYETQISEEVFDMATKQPDADGVMRNKRSLRKIFNDLQALIRTNFRQADSGRHLFITLTYAENMQDDKRLHDDFKKFFQKLKRHAKQHELAYINIVEPQERGAWHCHLLLKSLNHPILWIDCADIERLWGHGATRTERLNVSDIGSYFIAYLSNAELSDDKIEQLQIPDSDVKIKEGKKYVKGTRLSWYPDYMQIYRHSKNITYPTTYEGTDKNIDLMERAFPLITYQHEKIVETEARDLIISREERRADDLL